jgi:hypothetical protein
LFDQKSAAIAENRRALEEWQEPYPFVLTAGRALAVAGRRDRRWDRAPSRRIPAPGAWQGVVAI